MAAKSNPVQVTFSQERVTKNAVRFQEDTESDLAEEKIGQLYVKKGTLGLLGFAEGDRITVTIEIAS